MNRTTPLRWTVGATAAAVTLLAATAAMAQARQFTPGTDCSKVPQSQQVDCDMANQNSTMTPNPTTPLPEGNGTGTNQNGTLSPNGSDQTGPGGVNGTVSPGQTGN